MNKKTLIIAGGIGAALLLCVCIIGAGLVFMYTQRQITSNPTVETAIAVATVELPAQPTQPAQPDQPEPTKAPAQPTKAAPKDAPAGFSEEASAAAEEVADQLLNALANGEYEQATQVSISELRNKPTTTDEFRALVEDQGLKPSLWQWMKREPNESKQTFYLVGAMHFSDMRRGTVEVEMIMEDGDWKVNFLNLETDGSTTEPGAYSTWTKEREQEEVAFAKSAADTFLYEWHVGAYDVAYLMTAQPMRDNVGSEEDLKNFLTGLKVTPDEWTWDTEYAIIEPDGEPNPVIEFNADVTFQEGIDGIITLQMMWENGFWSVRYMNVKSK